MSIRDELSELAKKITDKLKEPPLDGDETEAIAKMFQTELDIENGNITQQEYCEIVEKTGAVIDEIKYGEE